MAAAICWGALAAIHAVPALALFRPELLSRLYGAEPGSDLFLLLRHRAALFLVIAVVCAWAAARPETRQVAAVSAGLSMASFLALYWWAGSPPALRAIALGDLAGLPFLVCAARRAFRPAWRAPRRRRLSAAAPRA